MLQVRFGSAPLSSRYFAISRCPLMIASTIGLILSALTSLISAPDSTSACTALMCNLREPRKSAPSFHRRHRGPTFAGRPCGHVATARTAFGSGGITKVDRFLGSGGSRENIQRVHVRQPRRRPGKSTIPVRIACAKVSSLALRIVRGARAAASAACAFLDYVAILIEAAHVPACATDVDTLRSA